MRVVPWLLVLVGCASHPHVDRVPVTMSPGHQVLVPVAVNGHAFVFQLDTGASDSVITTATWKRLGLPHGAVEEAAGAGGRLQSETVQLADLRVGERDVRDLAVAVMDLDETPGVDGILGQDVLARYIADVDLPNHHLVLHDKASTAWRTKELVALPYTLAIGGLIRLDATLEGHPLVAILDLGAGATIANTRAGGNGVASNASALGADGKPLEMTSLANQHVAVGELGFAASMIYISALPVFEEFGLADQPAMIIGIDLLASHRLVIDPDAKRIYLSR